MFQIAIYENYYTIKHLPAPAWIDEKHGQPILMLFSVVDDRSGVTYQEYHCAYGEAVEVALQFLFNAMAPKTDDRFPFRGRPTYLYLESAKFWWDIGMLGSNDRMNDTLYCVVLPERRYIGRLDGNVEMGMDRIDVRRLPKDWMKRSDSDRIKRK